MAWNPARLKWRHFDGWWRPTVVEFGCYNAKTPDGTTINWSLAVEHEMKISPTVVRRLRSERGWAQDQLAAAAGVSLRTIQRVEAEGAVSRETRVSLAATFNIPLSDLAEECSSKTGNPNNQAQRVGILAIGMVILACALLSESGRLPGQPTSDAFAALNALMGAVGALLVIPAAFRLIARHYYAGVLLAALGIPLTVLMIAALMVALFSGRSPPWEALAMGVCGVALVVMARRLLPNRNTGQERVR